ncbi:MAG: ABC transporter ATP-binding protein/permease [Propionibacteriaceae bacterium]|jgi:ATP-binding cassette subfamily B protein|nr:ABC transporter ATP-binding protein/permease [Propionibacteriaceae bacterium]
MSDKTPLPVPAEAAEAAAASPVTPTAGSVDSPASAASAYETTDAPERPKYGPQRRHGGPGGHGPGGPGARVAEKALNFGPSLKRLLGYLKPERLRVALALIMAAASVTMNVYIPRIIGKATDTLFGGVIGKLVGEQLEKAGVDPATVTKAEVLQVIEAGAAQGNSLVPSSMLDMLARVDFTPGVGVDFHQLALWCLAALGLATLAAIGLGVTGWLINAIVQRTVYRMREQVAGKLDRLPLGYFDSLPRGELLSRVTNDIDNISQSLQQTLSQMVQAVFQVIGFLIMMLIVSPLLTLVAVASIPVALIVVGVIMGRSQKRFLAMWKTTGELNGQIEEAYSGHALVSVFGRRKEVEDQFKAKNQEMYEAAFSAQFISGLVMPIMGFIGNLSYVIVAVAGCLRVASGHITIGDVTAFIQYSRQFTQPINQLASMTNLLQSGVASAERVFAVLDVAEESPDATGTLPVPVRGRVTFEHVQFAYSPDKPLITDLSLTAEPGQTVAIVGPTGAGKTTLVNLLMRFYEVEAGRITLDGVDIRDIPRADLRDQIGMVLQDTWLFYGTIYDNIAYGQPGASEDTILAAAKATYVDRFVRSLPDGYETMIDEEASNVSAGEKQLLTIARAFVSDPALLILDEATSSVDTRTEVLIQKAMGALRQGRTSFVIAHRLSTIRDADLILVMEHGDIVEQGTHQQLLAAKGHYYDLYQTQFAAGREEEEVAVPVAARPKQGGLFG